MCSAGLICVQTSLNLYAIGNIGTCISLPVLNFPFFLRGSIQTALWEQHLSTVTYISHTTQPSLHNTQFLQLYNDQLFQSSLFFLIFKPSCTYIRAFPAAFGSWPGPLSLRGAVFVLNQAPVLHRGVSAHRKQVHFLCSRRILRGFLRLTLRRICF